MKKIAKLIGLWRDNKRPSREAKAITDVHITDLKSRVAAMQQMINTLEHLSHTCCGDDRPTCPILDGLSDAG